MSGVKTLESVHRLVGFPSPPGLRSFKKYLLFWITTFMYKYIKEILPSSFNGMFAPFVEPNRTQSFKLELIRNKYLKPFPKIFLTRIWNSVPMNIKCSLSVLSFKTNMKIYPLFLLPVHI